ncbi:eppin-like isoform X2 [Saccostrea cucullata]|uniref:eppin-like isoform X2 n=1 Tax=Saccostrea cuccullata TaxID=36930 RepID=UPI002ED1C08C
MQGTIFILLFSACALAQIRPPPPINPLSGKKRGTCPLSRLNTTCECNEADRRCKWDKECPGVCLYNGRKYKQGEKFPSEDGCNTCICSSIGKAMCPRMACIGQDICSLPKVVGPCQEALGRWWYNRGTNRCESFTYGGCQGNKNNFQSIRECNTRCRKGTNRPSRPGRIRLPGPSRRIRLPGPTRRIRLPGPTRRIRLPGPSRRTRRRRRI